MITKLILFVLSMSPLITMNISAQAPRTSQGPGGEPTVKNTALTERSVRRIWKNCVEAEEANNMLNVLVSEGRGTDKVEAYSRGRAGRERWEDRGEAGRLQVVKEEMLSRIANSDAKVKVLKGSLQVKYKFALKVGKICTDFEKIKSFFENFLFFSPRAKPDILLTNPKDLIITLQWSTSFHSRDLFT